MNHLPDNMGLRVGQASIAGVKPVNEDAIGIRIPSGGMAVSKGAAAVIADGVSAAEAGKEASETCVHSVLNDYFSTPDSWSVRKSVQQVLAALNRWLYAQGSHFAQAERGYVSTLSVAIFKSHTAYLFHVGDTRIYRYRDGVLEPLTRDHATRISESQTYLTRAMGLDVRLEIDCSTVDLCVGDVFFLSSDGLHDVLSDVEISAVLQQGGDEGVMCQSLVNQALQAGSTDNISCQLVRIDQLPAEHADDFYRKLTELPFPPPLKAGLSVDGYRVLREIHASARSQLYVVEDETDGKRYCMKTPSANFDDDPAYIERFIMEGWIGRRVHNAHVAKVIEPSRPRTFLYYLTEYVNGPTLEQWMRENPRASLDQVIYITDQIAQGLRALHRREILHQDIKPANIMLTRDGEAKIVDFGSCHVAGAAEIVTPFQRDVALGTVTYSAPEYTLRLPGTPASDVFSLAVMAYQMLTGQLPFDGKLEQCRHREQYLALRYTPSYEINPLVPVWMDGPIRRCLRLDPAARYQEVSEFIYDMTHPNPKYHRPFQRAHIDKDPLMFWKRCVVILLLVQCALVVALLHDT